MSYKLAFSKIGWLPAQAMNDAPPVIATTFGSEANFEASAEAFCGSSASSSKLYLIGRPLMPPLALTQSKYALADFGDDEKSMPPDMVAIAPILIGWPAALVPLARPHLAPPAATAAMSESVPLLDDPHAARAKTRTPVVAAPRRRGAFMRISLW